jgi:hypothetical protein
MSESLIKGPTTSAERAEADAAATVFKDGVRRVRPTHFQRVGHSSGQVLQYRPSEIIDDPHAIRIMDELGVEYVEVDSKPKRQRVRAAATAATTTTSPPAVEEPETQLEPDETLGLSDDEGSVGGIRDGAD